MRMRYSVKPQRRCPPDTRQPYHYTLLSHALIQEGIAANQDIAGVIPRKVLVMTEVVIC